METIMVNASGIIVFASGLFGLLLVAVIALKTAIYFANGRKLLCERFFCFYNALIHDPYSSRHLCPECANALRKSLPRDSEHRLFLYDELMSRESLF